MIYVLNLFLKSLVFSMLNINKNGIPGPKEGGRGDLRESDPLGDGTDLNKHYAYMFMVQSNSFGENRNFS